MTQKKKKHIENNTNKNEEKKTIQKENDTKENGINNNDSKEIIQKKTEKNMIQKEKRQK